MVYSACAPLGYPFDSPCVYFVRETYVLLF